MISQHTSTHVSFTTQHEKPHAPVLSQQSIIHDQQAYQTTCFLPIQRAHPLVCMLPRTGFLHDQQAYQTTRFFSHSAYHSICVSAPQMLLGFPSKASFMINELTKPHFSLPTKHPQTQPLASLLPESKFIHGQRACQTTCFFSHPAYQDVSLPPSTETHGICLLPNKRYRFTTSKHTKLHASLLCTYVFARQKVLVHERLTSIPNYMVLRSSPSKRS